MVAVGGGWRGGMGGGFRGGIGEWVADSGIGDSGIGELAARESGCGKPGIRESQISGIRGIRDPETDSELTGVHNCAHGSGIRRNSPLETGNPAPGNPRISK